MIVNEYDGSLVRRMIDGVSVEVKNNSRSIHFKLNSVYKSIKYLLEAKKKDKDKIQSVKDRATYVKTNCSFTNPTMLAGTPSHAAAVDKEAKKIDDEYMQHFLKHATPQELKNFNAIKNMSGITEEERAKALRSFYAYELVMAFHPDEMAGLSRPEQAALISEMQHEFYKDFTGCQTLNHKYFGVIQFDTDNPHEQFMISSYDFDGKRLNLHNNYQRFQDFIARMETHHKYGKYLKQVVTAKREKNEFPNKEERQNTEQLLNSCFAKNTLNYLETKANLAEHNIMLDPRHFKNKLQKVMIKQKGKKQINSKGLSKEIQIGLSRYLELKELDEKHPRYNLGQKLHTAINLIKTHRSSTLDDLDSILHQAGFGLEVTMTKAGFVQGYSLYLEEINESVKFSTLGITKKELQNSTEQASIINGLATVRTKNPTVDVRSEFHKARIILDQNRDKPLNEIDKILNRSGYGLNCHVNNGEVQGYGLVLLDVNHSISLGKYGMDRRKIKPNPEQAVALKEKYRKIVVTNVKTGKEEEIIMIGNEAMIVDALGNMRPLFRKRKRVNDYPSLLAYMQDNGGKFQIALKTRFTFKDHRFYRNNVETFRITQNDSNNLKTSVSSTDVMTARAVAQLYLDSGYTGFRITSAGSDTAARNLWREGSLLGLKVEGYTPTPQDLAWLKEKVQPKIEQARAKNLEAINDYKAQRKPFDIKVASNQWGSIDRTPVAFAFVDLLKAGLNPMMVLNPPRKGQNKATDDDLKEMYQLILKTTLHECPQHLAKAKQHLEAYGPAKPIKVVTPPVQQVPAQSTAPVVEAQPAAPSNPHAAQPVANPTVNDIVRDFNERTGYDEKLRQEEIRRQAALEKAKEDAKKKK
ncbi:hypothetical protein AAA536_07870 [Pseudomonas aeruginosa]